MSRVGPATRAVSLLAAVVLVVSSLGTVAPPGTDPGGDGVLGTVQGVAYDDQIGVTGADGLNSSERDAMTTRAMARLERLRGLDFRESVNVTVVSRAEYRANYSGVLNATHEAWNNQVWEGLFLVGSDRDVADIFNETFGTSVQGYYQPTTGNIVLVSDAATPRVSRRTLVHELVHALQDQHFGLGATPDTQDRQLSRNAVVEGEAERLATLYEQRCGAGWACVTVGTPATASRSAGASTAGAYRDQVLQVILFPYAIGPEFVSRVAERDGTGALDRLYGGFPDSTEQVLHAEAYPDETPVSVTVPDRSGPDWTRFDHDPVADTVGEASIAVMADTHGLGDASEGSVYRNRVSAGWAGDALVPYRTGDGEFGYVWETVWDSGSEAREFHDAYRELLDRHDAEAVDDGIYRIPANDPFGGAFRVTRQGATVRIVHGPTRASLSELHAP